LAPQLPEAQAVHVAARKKAKKAYASARQAAPRKMAAPPKRVRMATPPKRAHKTAAAVECLLNQERPTSVDMVETARAAAVRVNPTVTYALLKKRARKAQSKQRARQRKAIIGSVNRVKRLARRERMLDPDARDLATWVNTTLGWIYSKSKRMHAMPAPLGVADAGLATPPPPPEADIAALRRVNPTEGRFVVDDPGLPAGRVAGEPLKIRLLAGGALLLRVPPGASADAVVQRAAAACGLAPSELALFCGGRRLLGPAPLRQAGGVRVLRVVQRLAGGALELAREAALTAAFRKLAGGNGRITKEGFVAALTHPGGGRATTREEAEAEFGRFEAGDDGAVSCEAILAVWTVPVPPPHPAPEAEEAARMAGEEAARLATEQAAAEEAARVAAARLVTEQAAAGAAARVAVYEAARLATEQAAADEAARVAEARLVTEQAAAEEAARVAAEEAARLATEQAAAEEAARVAAHRPPHRPPAREVAVSERVMHQWRNRGGTELEAVLKSGAVALLDAKWVIELATRGGVLQPRQALPDEAFIALSEIQNSTFRMNEFHLPVVSISHCWLQPDHPDPHGHNLRAVARALEHITRLVNRFGVFLDFCSIHQNCCDGDGTPQDTAFAWLEEEGRLANGAVGRFPEENFLFKQALGSLGTFYWHPHTHALMLTAFPPDYFTAAYKRSGNVKPYFERGWCFCESAWAMMVKNHSLLLDLGKDTGEGEFDDFKCGKGRKAPVLPEEFEAQLKSKGFTNGGTDTPLAAKLYREGFEARFGAATALGYMALGWGKEEACAVARVLPHALALEYLELGGNYMGAEGVRALAEAFPHAPALERLCLNGNSLGNEGARALAEALPRAPKLERLDLGRNSIGDAGACALAEALPRAPALQKLNLEANAIGDDAKAVLRSAWGERRGELIL